MYRKVLLPASLLAATIIGAGIFALPYTFSQAGLGAGLFYLIFFSIVLALIHLMYADTILKTPEPHRFAGYAKIYLGESSYWITLVTTLIEMFFTLTLYLVLSISFINLIYPALPGGVRLLIFWFAGSAPIFWKIKRVAAGEFLIALAMLLVIFFIFALGLNNLKGILRFPLFNPSQLFLPYGAVLFALYGRVAIPATIDYFKKITSGNAVSIIKKSILAGTIIPAIVYFLFVIGVWGAGKNITEDAVSGLIGELSPILLAVIGFLGIISLWSTYIMIGRDINQSLKLDLRSPKILAGALTIFIPLILYFSGFQNFLKLLGVIGGIFVGLEGIFIVLMWRKARKINPDQAILKSLDPLVSYGLLLVFVLGIILTVIGN